MDNEVIKASFKLALDDFWLDVNLTLPSQGVSVFYGHSGSGKTTLLRCIAGLSKASHGFLQVRGEIWQDSKQELFLPTYQRPIAYVFQEASLFPHLDVYGNLTYGQKRAKNKAAGVEQSLQAVIELLGIGHLLSRSTAKLSGGERQRVAIARALAVSPQILLMDEPLASLDPERKQEILPFLSRLTRELAIPILYVTHSPQEVTRLADYLVVLNAGRVQTAGELEAALTDLESPMVRSKQASTVISVTVSAYEEEYALLRVIFSGGYLSLPYYERFRLGEKLRLRIYARDVSLSLQIPQETSILNILPAYITGMLKDEQGQMIVQLRVGDVSILANITTKSVLLLQLQQGMQVFAQIKASAIL